MKDRVEFPLVFEPNQISDLIFLFFFFLFFFNKLPPNSVVLCTFSQISPPIIIIIQAKRSVLSYNEPTSDKVPGITPKEGRICAEGGGLSPRKSYGPPEATPPSLALNLPALIPTPKVTHRCDTLTFNSTRL